MQFRNVPSAITDVINPAPLRARRRNSKGVIERGICRCHMQIGIEDQYRLSGSLDESVSIRAARLRIRLQRMDILQADHCAINFVVPGFVWPHSQRIPMLASLLLANLLFLSRGVLDAVRGELLQL